MGKVGISFVCFLAAFTSSLGATDISYEGELSVSGAPADGWFDFRFQLFDQSEDGGTKALGSEILIPGIRVTDGRFQVEIDPGSDLGQVSEVWLEIGVRQPSTFGDYTALYPRQRLVLSGARDQSAKAATVPTGGVVFFATPACPAGWSEYLPARGRFVLGLPASGTVGATFGTPLSDLEDRTHEHSISKWLSTAYSGSHNHPWSRLFINPGGDRVWTSYNSAGSEIFLVNWGNGVGNEGSGYYPLAATPTQTLYTDFSADHKHNFNLVGSTGEASTRLPYVQLLACRKD